MKVGDIVVYHQPLSEEPYNGHLHHPALVTAVWSADCVNLKVFFDCGPIEDRTSVNPLSQAGGFSKE